MKLKKKKNLINFIINFQKLVTDWLFLTCWNQSRNSHQPTTFIWKENFHPIFALHLHSMDAIPHSHYLSDTESDRWECHQYAVWHLNSFKQIKPKNWCFVAHIITAFYKTMTLTDGKIHWSTIKRVHFDAILITIWLQIVSWMSNVMASSAKINIVHILLTLNTLHCTW